jgi:hypothetical protein
MTEYDQQGLNRLSLLQVKGGQFCYLGHGFEGVVLTLGGGGGGVDVVFFFCLFKVDEWGGGDKVLKIQK